MSLTIRRMNDEQLKNQFEDLVQKERKLTSVVIEHLAELDKRQLHLKWGWNSLYDYLTRGLHYSEGAANRRITAARALRQMPELKDKIQDGSLKLSQISQVQQSVRLEEQTTGKKLSLDEKREIFSQIENKTLHETHKVLDQKLATFAPVKAPVEVRHKHDDSVQVTLTLSAELKAKLERVKELYAHIKPGANLVELLDLMATDVIKKRDVLAKKERQVKPALAQEQTILYKRANAQSEQGLNTAHEAQSAPGNTSKAKLVDFGFSDDANVTGTTNHSITQHDCSKDDAPPAVTLAPAPQSSASEGAQVKQEQSSQTPRFPTVRKAIPAQVQRVVLRKNQNHGCEYVGADGRRCGSRHLLEFDHQLPVFTGGENSAQNLRLLCRAHNQYRYRANSGFRYK